MLPRPYPHILQDPTPRLGFASAPILCLAKSTSGSYRVGFAFHHQSHGTKAQTRKIPARVEKSDGRHCTARDRDPVLNCFHLGNSNQHTRPLTYRDLCRHKYPRPSLSLLPKTMSGSHVVQCLCHGQIFWGQATENTGDLNLQVRNHQTFHSPLTYTPSLTSRSTLRSSIPRSSGFLQRPPPFSLTTSPPKSKTASFLHSPSYPPLYHPSRFPSQHRVPSR